MSTSNIPGPPPPPLTERIADWAARHKALIAAVSAGAIAGGAALYLYSASRDHPNASLPGPGGAVGKGKGKGKNKKKGKKGGAKRVGDDDGPLLEERKPKEQAGKPAPGEADFQPPKDLSALTAAERDTLAQQYKSQGNKAYAAKKWAEAAELYTKAIEASVKPEAVFWSNRAACYNNLNDYPAVIRDCDEALALEPEYVKALNRRAQAKEHLDDEFGALCDFTAATILDKFQNDQASKSVERVLKTISEKKAREILAAREPRLPQSNFIQAYLNAFRPHTPPALPGSPTQGDQTLLLALSALDAADYAHALSLTHEAIAQGFSSPEIEAEALNLRGTFYFLINDAQAAIKDLERSVELKPDFVQSWVKAASVYMELGNPQAAFSAFETAIEKNPADPDTYYHRGQVFFILSDFARAIENYERSAELDPTFIFSHIQLAVAQYKSGNIAKSMVGFRTALRTFPDRSEVSTYYGELLMDQGRFEDAIEKFDRAIELDANRKPPNVLPMINKALAIFQWKQDLPLAEELVRKAVSVDPENDVAVGTLAQLCLQQGKIDDAIDAFARSAEVSRTEPELVNAITYQHATMAQREFISKYPQAAQALGPLARQMSA